MKLTLRNERFLLMDSAVNEPDKPRILAFTSPYGIELLKGNRNWCVDGTLLSPSHDFRLNFRHILFFSKALRFARDHQLLHRQILTSSRLHSPPRPPSGDVRASPRHIRPRRAERSKAGNLRFLSVAEYTFTWPLHSVYRF